MITPPFANPRSLLLKLTPSPRQTGKGLASLVFNMKKYALLPVIVAGAMAWNAAGADAPATVTPASDSGTPSSFFVMPSTVSVTPAFVSDYMFRGVRLGGPSFQPAAELDWTNLIVGLWVNLPISDRVPGVSDPEVDPYASYTFNVNDSLSIVPGFTVYTYPDADAANGFYKVTFEPYLAVNYTLAGVKLTPKAYYDVILQGPTFELNAAYTVPLAKLHTELDFAATVGTYFWDDSVNNASPRVKNSGSYYQLGVTLPFALPKNFTLTPGVAWVQGFDNRFRISGQPDSDNGAAVGRVVFSLSLGYSF